METGHTPLPDRGMEDRVTRYMAAGRAGLRCIQAHRDRSRTSPHASYQGTEPTGPTRTAPGPTTRRPTQGQPNSQRGPRSLVLCVRILQTAVLRTMGMWGARTVCLCHKRHGRLHQARPPLRSPAGSQMRTTGVWEELLTSLVVRVRIRSKSSTNCLNVGLWEGTACQQSLIIMYLEGGGFLGEFVL